MKVQIMVRGAILAGLVASLAGCNGIGSGGGGGFLSGDSGLFGRRDRAVPAEDAVPAPGIDQSGQDESVVIINNRGKRAGQGATGRRSRLFDLFRNNADPNVTVEVNKYLWQASLEVLDFLPIQSVDPFSGVIVTGYGTPPGGGRAYKATIYVQDPALDARSLKVALMSRSGPVDVETARAVEDAILTRARQLRIRDSKL
ncbi:MAG: DUF3576 domain-containing protein [Rhodobacteraceae bacterium]|nr:DUF3576 domain-containing protein [Paracoccaceae bacterium]MCP5342754.1 DUF3576 domain-containing protein [Paracoccaceae bacterium]